MGAKDRILDLLQSNIGQFFTLEEIAGAAKIFDFPRVLRALRQEGWDIERDGFGKNTRYCLRSLNKGKGRARTHIDAKTRYRILQRDNSVCQRCGRTVGDGVKLIVDHKRPVDWGGTNDDHNLWTLCRECNGGKQAFFNDFDADTMNKIVNLPTSSSRLKEFVRRNYGKSLPYYTLEAVAGIRDWERQIRKLRQNGFFNYTYDRKAETYTFRAKSLSSK